MVSVFFIVVSPVLKSNPCTVQCNTPKARTLLGFRYINVILLDS